MRVIRAAEHRVMPWKNGSGTTREIMVHPAGASIEDFSWRISMAHVTADGPFSLFPQVDRTLCILDGRGFWLTLDDRPAKKLNRVSAPFAFPADQPASATLIGGPVVDLNVMSRRGAWYHFVARDRVRDAYDVGPPTAADDVSLIVLARGAASARLGRKAIRLRALDTVLLDQNTPGMVEIVPDGETLIELYVIGVGRPQRGLLPKR